jgi:hypothetical protein
MNLRQWLYILLEAAWTFAEWVFDGRKRARR